MDARRLTYPVMTQYGTRGGVPSDGTIRTGVAGPSSGAAALPRTTETVS